MASRFPSIEEFDDGQTSPVQAGATDLDIGLGDPDTDFLSREKATLGADAELFASEVDDALLSGGADEFGSSFPSLEVGNEQVGPGGTVTGSAEPYLPGVVNTNAYAGVSSEPEEEPEVIKQWRERRRLEIEQRDKISQARKEETIKKAQAAIDDFYENYNQKRDKLVEETRREAEEFLASRENTVAGGTAWERIAKLVDLSEKGARSSKTDKTRFRELLLSLRKDEKAPGASGY